MLNKDKSEILRNMSEQMKNEMEIFDKVALKTNLSDDDIREFYKNTWNNYCRTRNRILYGCGEES